MHSRIFHLINEEEKDFKEAYEEDLYERISVADCVVKSNDLFDDWKWLLHCYGTFMKGEKQNDFYIITIVLNKLEEYFKEKTEKLKELVNKITKESWEFLANDMLIYQIETLIDDRFGFYVFHQSSIDTFHTWLSIIYSYMLSKNLKKMTFKVVETFDYHS